MRNPRELQVAIYAGHGIREEGVAMLSNKIRRDLLNELEYLIETNGSPARIRAIRRDLAEGNRIRRIFKNETK